MRPGPRSGRSPTGSGGPTRCSAWSTSNVSYTYTATETNPADAGQLGRAGGPPRQLLPVPAAGHQTVAVLSGAASVTASSYGSWIADTQQDDPVNAFDGNPATAWAEGNELTPVGQWIQINFAGPLDLPARVGIRLLDDSTDREIASVLRVSTAAGQRHHRGRRDRRDPAAERGPRRAPAGCASRSPAPGGSASAIRERAYRTC